MREVRFAAWRSIGLMFKRGRRRGYQSQLRLTEAYNAVFRGRPSPEDQELVLADLLKESGFARVSLPTSTNRQLWHQEGKRDLYSVIHSHLTMQEADLQALQVAARREAAVDADPTETINQ